MSRRIAATILVALAFSFVSARVASAITLVDDPFIDSYNNWVDTFTGTPQVGQSPDWRLHFFNNTMMESSDGRAGDGTGEAGNYTPYLLIQDGVTTPDSYDLTARMFTSDDDLFGLVFGWQDNDNYFRVSMRQQSPGNLGAPRGLAVQKVVGGVATQIDPAGPGAGNTAVPTAAMITGREPIDVTISVVGTSYSVSVAGVNGGSPLAGGTDLDLAPGKVGILSWAQRIALGMPAWGTEVDSLSVTTPAGVLFNDTFTNFSPVQWRQLVMTNSAGVTLPVQGDDNGNFGLDFRNRSIHDNSNGFEWATEATLDSPNVDFIGPAIAVDEPGSESFSDYVMRVRMKNGDDDGLGVLVRVQDDDTFYRINFTNQALGSPQQPHERAPRGLSVQKVQDGVWSELFRDNQDNPLFVFTIGQPFDVSVTAVGNQLMVQVIEDPDGAANVINYPVIVDADDPILTGTVGLANWGSGAVTPGGAVWSAFGGVPGPLLTFIPEPASALLLLAGAGGLMAWRRRPR